MLPVIADMDVLQLEQLGGIEQYVFPQFTSTDSFDAYETTVSAMLEKQAEVRQQQHPPCGGMPPQENFGHGMSQQPPLGYR